MKVQFSPEFDRQFNARLSSQQKIKVLAVLDMFTGNPIEKELRNHELKGEWLGYRSISIGGDLRLHFKMIDEDFAYFVAVGSHEQLYR